MTTCLVEGVRFPSSYRVIFSWFPFLNERPGQLTGHYWLSRLLLKYSMNQISYESQNTKAVTLLLEYCVFGHFERLLTLDPVNTRGTQLEKSFFHGQMFLPNKTNTFVWYLQGVRYFLKLVIKTTLSMN